MAIWPLFLIALYWLSQNAVETEDLPNKHLVEATNCMREFLSEDVISQPFRYILTIGEYLGDLCNDDGVEIIKEKIKNYPPEGSQKVQECLEKKELPDVYSKIRDHGSEKLAEAEKREKLKKQFMPYEKFQQLSSFQRRTLEEDMSDEIDDEIPSPTTIGKNDKVETPKSPQTTSFEETQSADVKLTQSPTGAGVSGVHESHEVTRVEKYSEEINLENVPDLSKFIIGLCMMDDSIDFQKLENDEDKIHAMGCLKKCSTNFMYKIDYELSRKKSEIGWIMSKIKQKFLAEIADSKKVSETGDSKKATETADPKEVADSESKLLSEQYQKIIDTFLDQTKMEIKATSSPAEISFKKQKLSEEVDKPSSSKKIFDIGDITKANIPIMIRYSEVYSILNKYLDESYIEPDKDFVTEVKKELMTNRNTSENEISLDSCLKLTFIQYKSCAKVECSMKAPESVPLCELIMKKASKQEFVHEGEEAKALATADHKFFVALTRGEVYDSDSDSDSDDDDDNDDEDDDDDDDSPLNELQAAIRG